MFEYDVFHGYSAPSLCRSVCDGFCFFISVYSFLLLRFWLRLCFLLCHFFLSLFRFRCGQMQLFLCFLPKIKHLLIFIVSFFYVSVNIFCRFCSTFYLPFISIPIKIPQKIHPRCTPSLASAGVLFFLFLCVCVRSASPAALHCFGGVAAGHGDGPRV